MSKLRLDGALLLPSRLHRVGKCPPFTTRESDRRLVRRGLERGNSIVVGFGGFGETGKESAESLFGWGFGVDGDGTRTGRTRRNKGHKHSNSFVMVETGPVSDYCSWGQRVSIVGSGLRIHSAGRPPSDFLDDQPFGLEHDSQARPYRDHLRVIRSR
jgi:hypothetical protein